MKSLKTRAWKEGDVPSLYHFGLTVSDLGKSLEFYRDVVGMKEEYYSEIGSDEFDTLINNKGVKIKFHYLTLGSFRLQIIEYQDGGDEDRLSLRHNKVGNPHLSFWIEDVEQKYNEVKTRGDVTVTSDIITQEYEHIGARTFYVSDPDGVQIEFCERLYDHISES